MTEELLEAQSVVQRPAARVGAMNPLLRRGPRNVRHARPLSDGTIRVRWKIRGDVVEIEVTDGGGESLPRPAPRTVWLSSGRGLRIVRSIAHEWGVTEDRTGNVVWATLGGPSRRRAT